MKYNKIFENGRKRVVDAFNNEDWRDTAKTLGINLKTTYKIWLLNDQKLPKKRRGKVSKQTDEMINRIKNPLLTLKELAEMDHNEFDVIMITFSTKNVMFFFDITIVRK